MDLPSKNTLDATAARHYDVDVDAIRHARRSKTHRNNGLALMAIAGQSSRRHARVCMRRRSCARADKTSEEIYSSNIDEIRRGRRMRAPSLRVAGPTPAPSSKGRGTRRQARDECVSYRGEASSRTTLRVAVPPRIVMLEPALLHPPPGQDGNTHEPTHDEFFYTPSACLGTH